MENTFKVLTVRDVEFKDDRNNQVKGQQLWLLGETEEPEWNGHEIIKLWIPDGHELENKVTELSHGDDVIIEFNRRGKPTKIEVI